MTRTKYLLLIGIGLGLGGAGCGDDTGSGTDMVMGGADLAAGADLQQAGGDMACVAGTDPKCPHAATDYEPRVCASQTDKWPACISDDNTYHLIGMGTPAAAARTLAWDQMGPKLWLNPSAPSKDDFLAARDLYTIPNGLASRVERRQDVHYPELGAKLACTDPAVAAANPDRCAGPTRLLPIINDAFTKGAAGTEPRVQAARIEVALLWFTYLSTLSEIWTCGAEAIADCDSMFGYFNAAQGRDKPAGLGKYLADRDRETYDRAFDGILAVRCWRDLDKDVPRKDATLQKQAQDQLDKAELRGLALILKDRFGKIGTTTGEVQAGHMAFVAALGPLFDRAARAIDPAKADALKAQYTANAPSAVSVTAAQDAIDALFPCP